MSTEPEPSRVRDLMAALEKSFAEAKAARAAHPVAPQVDCGCKCHRWAGVSHVAPCCDALPFDMGRAVAAPGSPEERHDDQ